VLAPLGSLGALARAGGLAASRTRSTVGAAGGPGMRSRAHAPTSSAALRSGSITSDGSAARGSM
jgi:hypothetical protein